MRLFGFAAIAVMVAGAALVPATADAAVMISCPGTPANTDREFTLTTGTPATCLGFGNGNINGNGDAINDWGYLTLDKSDNNSTGALDGALTITGSGSTGGTFSILPSVLGSYSDLVIAFKSGAGNLNPDWAAFLLPTSGLNGTWSISDQQSLSHAILYGKLGSGTGGGKETVPEPASIALFGLAALAAGHRMRRRAVK